MSKEVILSLKNSEDVFRIFPPRIGSTPYLLTKFIFEDRRYKPDELVGIVKRIKEWGSTSSEEEVEYVDS